MFSYGFATHRRNFQLSRLAVSNARVDGSGRPKGGRSLETLSSKDARPRTGGAAQIDLSRRRRHRARTAGFGPFRSSPGATPIGSGGWLPALGTRGFQRPSSDPSTDLQVRCHGSERDGRDVPLAVIGLSAAPNSLSPLRAINGPLDRRPVLPDGDLTWRSTRSIPLAGTRAPRYARSSTCWWTGSPSNSAGQAGPPRGAV
jgi:hypothetical protein